MNRILTELHRILRDEGTLIFLILVPLGYPLLYAYLYTNEVVREVPVVAVLPSSTSMGREFVRMVDASPSVDIVLRTSRMEEAKEWMRRKEAYGIIYLPNDFERNLQRGEQTHVSLFCDMSALLYYKALVITCTDVSLKMNDAIRLRLMPGLTTRQEEVSTMPVQYESVTSFNPQSGFATFLIPAVLILIIQQTLLLGTGLLAGTDRDLGKRPHQVGGKGMLARAFACIIIGIFTCTYMLVAVPHLFHLPQLADALTLVTFILPYQLACTFFALTLSAFVPNREACMLLFVFTSVPLLFLSGISWPESNIPMGWKLFSYLFPSTFGINGFVHINTMGASLHEVKTEYAALWIQSGIYFLTASYCWRKYKGV
ncbi:MAG: ABC transporter permease [Bacteroidaceae bacterium]|nr:ABC transporter permease [Bacteroidaceae bacterium]